MSLLTLVQGAARAARVPVPAFVIGNNDTTTQMLLQLANDEGNALARRRPGGWVAMSNEWDFQTKSIVTTGTLHATGVITGIVATTTGLAANTWHVFAEGFPNNTVIQSVDSASQVTCNYATTATGAQQVTFGLAAYPLPTDYQRDIDGTFWDRSRFWQMRGAMSPQQWQLYKSSVLGYSATVQRRYRIQNIDGTVYLSIDPVPTDNGSNLVFEYVSTNWCKNAATGAGQTQWLLDTDLGILDEFLIQKGMIYRSLERLGMAYDFAQAEYNDLCDRAVAHDGGTQVIDMVQQNRLILVGPMNVPETGYG